jgi:hypothetical protein
MRARGVDPGVPLERLYAGQAGATTQAAPLAGRSLLVAVTELNPPEALDAYVAAAADVLGGPTGAAHEVAR